MSETTKIIVCNCEHKYQDSKYGKQKRLANKCGAKTHVFYRCTVCGSNHG